MKQERYDEAEAELRQALAVWENQVGSEHPDVAAARDNLAGILYARGRYEESEAEFRKVLALRDKLLGPEHPDVVATRTRLAQLLLRRGEAQEAARLAEQAWTATETRKDIQPEIHADAAFAFARALWKSNRDGPSRQRARDLAEQAAADYRTVGSVGSEKLAEVEAWLAAHRLP
jgi:tetratricopeptide (TPR) repeat protein